MSGQRGIDLTALRREYTLGGLRRSDLEPDPLVQFQKWFEQALTAQLLEPSAMALATVNAQGQPSVRMVLLKGVDARGFIFFTNYESRKAGELAANPRAALDFYWAELERQVCVTGSVEKLSRTESENYFKLRPRGSQLGAWVSRQSSTVADRAWLEQRLRESKPSLPIAKSRLRRTGVVTFWHRAKWSSGKAAPIDCMTAFATPRKRTNGASNDSRRDPSSALSATLFR